MNWRQRYYRNEMKTEILSQWNEDRDIIVMNWRQRYYRNEMKTEISSAAIKKTAITTKHQEQNASSSYFFCVRCDDCAKSSGRCLLGSPRSALVRQLAHRAWCPLQCLLTRTVGVLSPGVGRSEECDQEFTPHSYIHSGLNQQDPITYTQIEVWVLLLILSFLWVISIVLSLLADFCFYFRWVLISTATTRTSTTVTTTTTTTTMTSTTNSCVRRDTRHNAI